MNRPLRFWLQLLFTLLVAAFLLVPVLLAALRRAHRRGARIVGLCLGAFVLAEAGLLPPGRGHLGDEP